MEESLPQLETTPAETPVSPTLASLAPEVLVDGKKPSGSQENPLFVKPQAPFEKPKNLFGWEAPMRAYSQKGLSYLIALGLVAILIVLPLLFLRQFSLSLVVIASAFVLGVYGRVAPPDRHCEIWTTGVKVGDKLYLYKDLRAFWVKEEDGSLILHISTYLSLPYRLTMALKREEQEKIEEALIKYLPYQEEKERDFYASFNHLLENLVPKLPQRVVDFFSQKLPFKF